MYFAARVVVGLLFAVHGAQKFGLIGDGNIAGFASAMSLPLVLAWIAGGIELLDGLALALVCVFSFLSTGWKALVFGQSNVQRLPRT